MRRLTCIVCGCEVEVYEEPVEFVDPALFTCVPCLDDRHRPVQLSLGGEVPPGRVEKRRYDPSIAAVPY